MINFFKNLFFWNNKTEENVLIEYKLTKEYIFPSNPDEIKNAFTIESARLYKKAVEIHNKDNDLDNDSKLALELGFKNYKDIAVHQEKYNELLYEKKKHKILIDSKKWLKDYKWISQASILDICEQYNIKLGDVTDYIGQVPESKLKELKAFKEKYNKRFYYASNGTRIVRFYDSRKEADEDNNEDCDYGIGTSLNNLQIIAPFSDFKTTNGETKHNDDDGRVLDEIPHRTVLVRRDFNYKIGYYIISSW